jgi:hypothetical protein
MREVKSRGEIRFREVGGEELWLFLSLKKEWSLS